MDTLNVYCFRHLLSYLDPRSALSVRSVSTRYRDMVPLQPTLRKLYEQRSSQFDRLSNLYTLLIAIWKRGFDLRFTHAERIVDFVYLCNVFEGEMRVANYLGVKPVIPQYDTFHSRPRQNVHYWKLNDKGSGRNIQLKPIHLVFNKWCNQHNTTCPIVVFEMRAERQGIIDETKGPLDCLRRFSMCQRHCSWVRESDFMSAWVVGAPITYDDRYAVNGNLAERIDVEVIDPDRLEQNLELERIYAAIRNNDFSIETVE